jgi:hypothetical protein
MNSTPMLFSLIALYFASLKQYLLYISNHLSLNLMIVPGFQLRRWMCNIINQEVALAVFVYSSTGTVQPNPDSALCMSTNLDTVVPRLRESFRRQNWLLIGSILATNVFNFQDQSLLRPTLGL